MIKPSPTIGRDALRSWPPRRLAGVAMACLALVLPVAARAAGPTPLEPPPAPPSQTLEQAIDEGAGHVVGVIATVLLWDVVFWDNDGELEPSELPGGDVVSVVPDPLGWGTLVISSSAPPRLFDTQGKQTAVYEGFERTPTLGRFSADGRFVLLSAPGEPVRLYRRDGALLDEALVTDATAVAFHPAVDQRYYAGGADGRLLLATPEGHRTIAAHDGAITGLSLRSDARYLVSAAIDGKARVWTTEGELAQALEPGVGPLAGAAFDPSGTRLLTAARSGQLQVWDATGAQTHAFEVDGSVRSVAFTPAGQVFVLTERSAGLWNLEGKQVVRFGDARPEDAAMSKDGGRFVTWGHGSVSVWKATGELLQDLDGSIVSAQFASGSVVTIDGSGQASVWGHRNVRLPIVVAWLVLGAVFFTFRMRFVSVRLFRHAIDCVRGRYDNAEDEGEVTHFQALASALSATVGLGNIAGVAIAVSIGGPGATFWMITAGILGMASKFTECTLGQKYRRVRSDGTVMGGAMYYLSRGLAELELPRLGKVLAIGFAILCIGGSFGGGNAFQVRQSMVAVQQTIPALQGHGWVYGLIMVGLVGVVIIGGIKRIAQAASRIVPAMCGIYIVACLFVLFAHPTHIPGAVATIFASAFAPEAIYGGFVGVLVVGFQRAAFSNEAGIGSAAIAHAAARTEYPVREGVVALLEPFIDTVLVCTMTALVIVITGAYQNPEYGALIVANEGAALTSRAFGEVIGWFPYVLSIAVMLFAYSTMISWSYYGERCWSYLFGDRSGIYYRIVFLVFVFLGSIITATNVLDFSDLMILGMAFPNILGLVLLSGKVRRDLDTYEGLLGSGAFDAMPEKADAKPSRR